MKFNKDVVILEREDRVILVNSYNRKWYKLSRELFLIIRDAVNGNYTENILLSKMYDEEDRKIVSNVINNLRVLGILLENNHAGMNRELNFTIAITDRCNLVCKHCSYSAKYGTNLEKVSTKELIFRLKKILQLNPTSLAFTGGEPMVREDFDEILEWLGHNYKGHTMLMTNGTLINEENVKKIGQNFSQIDISIDGINEETCAAIRGRGVFDKVINSVHLLQERGFTKISLSMVDTHLTHKYIEQFFELNKKMGTHPVLRSFSAIGRGEINKNMFELQDDDYIEKKNKLSEEFRTNYKNNFKSSGCGAGKGNFFVDYDGSIYGCATLREYGYKIGEIEDIEQVIKYEENMHYRNMINRLPDKCKKCDVNIFCIECLADFFDIDQEKFDDFCNERKECIQDIVWGRE